MKRNLYLLPLVLTLLAACTALGVPTPQTFNEREAAGIAIARGVISTAKGLLLAGKITPDDVDNTIKQADTFMEAIDVAETIHAIDPAGGENKLAAAIIGLNALNDYVTGRK